jgi:tRNA (guanosine-2'-O-)-methyltransferase
MIEHPIITSILSKKGAKETIEILGPLLTQKRRMRIDRVINQRLGSVIVAIEEPSDIYNALAIVRSAEAFGVSSVDIIDCRVAKKKGWHTTLGTSQWTEVHYREDIVEQMGQLKKRGFSICGAVVDSDTALESIDLSRPVCLLFGNEERGLTDEAKRVCDQCFTIPMYGMVESFNISVAAGIALYEVTKKIRNGRKEGDLTPEEKELLTAAYYIRSIGFEETAKILS